jgi:hypothetical protein
LFFGLFVGSNVASQQPTSILVFPRAPTRF